jgi:tetratricopeptide (TPR) repeat protein
MWRFCFVALLAVRLGAQRAPESCEQFEAATRGDSASAQAWYRLGRCAHRDYEMVAPNGDSTRLAFRSSWTTALRALRRAVSLDPRFAPAYRPLFAILFAETRDGCSFASGLCTHVAPNLRDGDTVITIPRRVVVGPDPYGAVVREADASRRTNLLEARDVAARWASVAPNDPAPHAYLGRALLRLGDPVGAADELERAAAMRTPNSRGEIFFDRFEALVKANRGADARRAIDEAASNPGRDSVHLSVRLVGFDMLVGRVRRLPPRPIDWARARLNRARIDSMPANRFGSDYPQELFGSARMHLAVHDTAGAEVQLAELERLVMKAPFQNNFAIASLGPWLGDAWLLAGDVAAARGRRAEADGMYRRLVGLWEGGDSDLQHLVRDAQAHFAVLR